MFGKYFYNKNIRNIVILFGTLFNDINIRRFQDNTLIQDLKVPIAYGPAQKYLSKIEQDTVNDEDFRIGITLPRMSFEITSMAYDSARKLQTTQKIKSLKFLDTLSKIEVKNGGSGYTSPTVTISNAPSTGQTATATANIVDGVITAINIINSGSGYTSTPTVTITDDNGIGAEAEAVLNSEDNILITSYTPVPYNYEIDLSIMVLNSDDGAQILEQILPYFTPEFQVTMNELKTLGIKRDIPIILNSMSTEDDYEGDFLTRRSLTHTLSFTVQGYLYGPSEDQGIIREVDVNAGTFTSEFDTKLINIDIKPEPIDLEPDNTTDPNVTTTITNL